MDLGIACQEGGKQMSPQHATAEVFLTALKALPSRERAAVLQSIVKDRTLRAALEDISDRLVIAEERGKPGRPLRDYIAEREKRGRSKAKAKR
jgi:hypothetical protein